MSKVLGAGTTFQDLPFTPLMVVIPSGQLQMGSLKGTARELPIHNVIIPRALAVGAFPVTFDEWDRCYQEGGTTYLPSERPKNPPVTGSEWSRGQRPVINVGWYDAQDYVKWLSLITGHTYRLPSEAEWEYFARAGSQTEYAYGDELANRSLANCKNCGTPYGGKSTSPVGSFPPNAFGLYDVHGNVWEWVQDSRNQDTYWGAPTNSDSWEDTETAFRILRGGSWKDEATSLRSAARKWSTTGYRFNGGTLGFRVVRELAVSELGISITQLNRPLAEHDLVAASPELDSLQAGILTPHGRRCVYIAAICLANAPSRARAAISAIAPYITSFPAQRRSARAFKDTGEDGGSVISVHLSGGAYGKLAVDSSSFPPEFMQGMIAARARNNDPDPATYESPYANQLDMLLQVAASSSESARQSLLQLVHRISANAEVLQVEYGERREDERGIAIGPFGFADGISNPEFVRSEANKNERARVWTSDASPGLVVVPDPLCKAQGLGSYLVFRKFYADEALFEKLSQEIQQKIGSDCTREFAKAMFFGRFADGSPLAVSNQSIGGAPTNDFDFRADPDGTKCPFHSHIRKANPRGEHLGEEERLRRIVRRGFPFWQNGEWLERTPRGLVPNRYPENGLLFLAYQASIVEQFEFIQSTWLNDSDFLYGQFPGADPVAGQAAARAVDPSGAYVVDQASHHFWPTKWGGNREDRIICDIGAIVRLAGGEYFFTPSISWLKTL